MDDEVQLRYQRFLSLRRPLVLHSLKIIGVFYSSAVLCSALEWAVKQRWCQYLQQRLPLHT